MIIYLPILVCIIGLLLYFLAQDPQQKVSETGRLMFFSGLLVFLLQRGGVFVR